MVDGSDRTFFYVTGATASGKTALALDLASKVDAPIINCDSVQVYKDLKIGSAQPTDLEKATVPHHLFGYVSSGVDYSVNAYIDDVMDLFQRCSFKKALFCGGSGFYIQALQKGLFPKISVDETSRALAKGRAEEWGYEKLHQWVINQDPDHGRKFHFNDHYRVLRAAEILISTGQTVTALKNQLSANSRGPLPPHRAVKVGLYWERSEQATRLKKRVEHMLRQGWLQEVESLLQAVPAHWSGLSTVGYKQVVLALKEGWNQPRLIQEVVQASMQLIKKQTTWFKKQEGIQWFHGAQVDQARDWALAQVEDSLTYDSSR